MTDHVPLQGVFKELIQVVSTRYRSDAKVCMIKQQGNKLKRKAETSIVKSQD
jgi:hypothetical protein